MCDRSRCELCREISEVTRVSFMWLAFKGY